MGRAVTVLAAGMLVTGALNTLIIKFQVRKVHNESVHLACKPF
jgi:hypothetical protein